MTYAQTLPMLLAVYVHAETATDQAAALMQLEFMAFTADQFGKPLCIEVYAMAGDTLASDADQVRYYDVMVRCEGEDPIAEFEDLKEYPTSLIEQLQAKYPDASFEEIGG